MLSAERYMQECSVCLKISVMGSGPNWGNRYILYIFGRIVGNTDTVTQHCSRYKESYCNCKLLTDSFKLKNLTKKSFGKKHTI